MGSTFYGDAIELREPSPDKDEKSSVPATLQLTVDTVEGLGAAHSLVYCRASTSHHTAKTGFQSLEDGNVEFNQTLSLDLNVTEQQSGSYLPSVFYILIELRERISDESLCSTMLPVYSTHCKRAQCVLHAAVERSVATLTLYTQLELQQEFTCWHGTDTLDTDSESQCWPLSNIGRFPGSDEVCEICVRDAQVTTGQTTFTATIYLTNYRVLIICSDEVNKSCSTYINFAVIEDIEKSYETEGGVRYCSYKFKCSDVRTVKVNVRANVTNQRKPPQTTEVTSSETQFDLPDPSKERAKRVNPFTNMSTLTRLTEDICSSDGEANEVPSDCDNVVGEGMFEESSVSKSSVTSLAQLEYSDDEMLTNRLDSVCTMVSDVDSVDDMLDRTTSVSSFTSYLLPRGRGRSKGVQKKKRWKRSRHISKVSMDSLSARILNMRGSRELFVPLTKGVKRGDETEALDYTEVARLGIQSDWRVVDNSEYRCCKSYPPTVYIPSYITDKKLKQVLQFRSKGRIPVLSWVRGGAILLRSAQPKTGMFQHHCEADEELLNTARILSQSPLQFKIFDARSKIAAGGNRMKGKGTEDTTLRYHNTQLEHLDMANIHAIRDSHDKLASLCQTQCTPKWFTKLEATQWINHVQGLIEGAHLISSHLLRAGAALVHCSDGWDRTSQLTSLSLILIDSYYRTFEGFSVLVEREWLAFGHRFHDRLGYAHPSQRSPIFLLWLDALYQVMHQASDRFEFSPSYLLTLADLYSSDWTRTFLKNCVRERQGLDNKPVIMELMPVVQSVTQGLSVWDILSGMRDVLSNPLYKPSDEPIALQTSLRHMTLWKEYWLRYDTFTAPQGQQNIVIWEPDSDVVQCRLCRELFSALRRKHHCRSCGYVYCYQCAKRRIVLPEMGYNTPVLVCDTCHRDHSTKV